MGVVMEGGSFAARIATIEAEVVQLRAAFEPAADVLNEIQAKQDMILSKLDVVIAMLDTSNEVVPLLEEVDTTPDNERQRWLERHRERRNRQEVSR